MNISKIKPKIQKIFDKEGKNPVLTLRLYKRHILAIILIVVVIASTYGVYFRFFMVLPQTAANIMPRIPFSLERQRIMVVSPHCDDESLGAAGLMHTAKRQGSDIKVLITTDCNKHKLGEIRKAETTAAIERLGLAKDDLIFLDFPEVDSSKTKNSAGLDLKQSLGEEIAKFHPNLIIAPHPDDSHVDHKYVGKYISELTEEDESSMTVAYYLIHFNFFRYPSPTGSGAEGYLMPPARLITHTQRWYMLDLSSEDEDSKQEAILFYKSQLSLKNPILRGLLLDFVRKNELFMVEN